MNSKKYELVASDVNGLYRVKALMDFGNVKAGDIGGYVSGEHNLSHYGNSWVYDNARVFEHARVSNNASVSGLARVYGDARVFEHARVSNNASVSGLARVSDNARVFEHARVSNNASVSGLACVSGNARVSGSACVSGLACVSGNAAISNTNEYFVVGPALSSGRYTTVHKTAEGYQINCGCYTTDSIKGFKKRVKEVHSGDNLDSYLVIVTSLDAWVKLKLKREVENANS